MYQPFKSIAVLKKPSFANFGIKTVTMGLCFGVLGCQNYRVSVNNTDLINPLSLYQPVAIKDTALEACLSQTIQDRQLQNPALLTHLNCAKAGISTLDGIEQFTQLVFLDISSNRLYNVAPLLELDTLQRLDLKGNEQINCDQVRKLRAMVSKVGAPQCQTP